MLPLCSPLFMHLTTPSAADSFAVSGEGQAYDSWAPQEVPREPQLDTDSSTENFAPRGRPKIQDRIRNKLPGPLPLKGSNKIEALARIRELCSVSRDSRAIPLMFALK